MGGLVIKKVNTRNGVLLELKIDDDFMEFRRISLLGTIRR